MMHIPVLTKEVLEYLDPKANENFVDGTVGQAGHALLILEKNGSQGKVLGIDLDAGQIENSKRLTEKYNDRIILVHDSYVNLKNIVRQNNVTPVDGILLDLGWSSWQLESRAKGFSFLKDEVLDMRYGGGELTAEKIVNEYTQKELERILEEYGEERFFRRIAEKIIEQRSIKKIETTFDLKRIIESAVPEKFWRGRIHGATRSFQALRIAVNDELGNLVKMLPDAISVLAPGGRLAVISFHSLEDRIVKNFFKEQEKQGIIKILTKKPVMAGEQEVKQNSRARSAKLRAIVKSYNT